MPLNPFSLKNNLETRYIRYLKTLFPISDTELRILFNNELESGTFIRGPFIEIAPPYEKGESIKELIQQGILSELFLDFSEDILPERLYLHQSEAIRKIIVEKKNIVIASGTGSGKTESFLIPIINELFRQNENGLLSDGVRALFLYPMNVLVNDQLERLRKVLRSFPFITFGRYTGETKEFEANALSKYQEIHGLNNIPCENERISREKMRENPPHILLTNYAMLEYLLLRPSENIFFDGDKAQFWKFIVLDEAHIYTGAKGLEIAMLLRRVKDRVIQSKTGRLTCIATSATLGDESYKKEVALFATHLFNENFSDDSIISAKRLKISECDPWINSPDPEFYQKIIEILNENSDIDKLKIDDCIKIARNYHVDSDAISESLEKTDNPRLFIYYLLKKDPRLLLLQQRLTENTDTVQNIANYIFPDLLNNENYLTTLITASSFKYLEELPPLLSARYHLFLKAAEGAFVTFFPEKKIYLKPLKSNLESIEEEGVSKDFFATAYELGLCKFCGAPFLVGTVILRGIKKFFEQKITTESESGKPQNVTYLSFINSEYNDSFDYDDDDDIKAMISNDLLENLNSKIIDITAHSLCGICGRLLIKNALNDSCEHDSRYYIDVLVITPQTKDKDLHKCPICSKTSKHSPLVTRFLTGRDSVPGVLATELYQQLTDVSFECKRDNNLCFKRNLLIFSDSRQDAAFFAPYFERMYQKVLRRTIICSIVQRNQEDIVKNRWDILNLIEYILKSINESNLFCCNKIQINDQRKINEIKKWLMFEFISRGDAGRLEQLGLLGFLPNLDNLTPHGALMNEPWSFSHEEVMTLYKILFDQFRVKGAIDFPDGINPKEDFFSPINREYYFTKIGTSPSSFSWVPQPHGVTFFHNGRSDVLKRIAKRQDLNVSDESINKILSNIWNSIQPHLQQKSGGKFQAKPEKWIITSSLLKSQIYPWYYCDKCSELTLFNLKNVCPEYHCTGTLHPFDPLTQFQNNHYSLLYKDFNPIRMRAEEHTAQLTHTKAAKIQEEFIKGQINVISSSTTFELGVNIGELECVFMRNLPPNPANYIQRSGRAGRNAGSAAVAITFCQRRPHDLSFFNRTDAFIKGEIKPPRIEMMNNKIVSRHLFSMICAAFWREYPNTFNNSGGFFFPENCENIDSIAAITEFLEKRPNDLMLALKRVAPIGLFPDSFFENWEITPILISEDPDPDKGKLSKVALDIRNDISLLEERKKELINNDQLSQAAKIKKIIETIKNRSIINHLSSHNILPKYGFPVDVVTLEILYRAVDAEDIALSRDLSIALSEYAPGSEVVAGGKVWQSRYIKMNPKTGQIIKRIYSLCKTCNLYRSDILEINPDLSHCSNCNQKIDKTNIGVIYMPQFGFIASNSPPHDIGEYRPEKTHSTRVYYSGEKGEDLHTLETVIYNLNVKGWAAKDGKLAIVNNAHKNGFAICPVCGYAEVHQGITTGPHTNAAGRGCNTPLRFSEGEQHYKIHLGHEFKTDICILTFPGNFGEDFRYSLLYAVLEGASEILDIERQDINGCLYKGDLVLYDAVPGGAGLVKRIVESEKNLQSAITAAYSRLCNCSCGGTSGDGSCYACLRNYSNQFCHEILNRGEVISYFKDHGFVAD